MTKRRILILVLWIGPGLAGAAAQAPGPLQPSVPILPRAPALASWTIQFKYPAEARQSPPAPDMDRAQSVTVTKTNKTYREQTIFKSGKREEKWIYDNIQLMMPPGSNMVLPVSPPGPDSGPNPDYSDYRKGDFPGLEWVSLDNFKSVQSYQGEPVYLFESTGAGGNLTAMLSVATQSPVYFSDGGATRIYSYNPPPSAALIPPKQFMNVLEALKRGIQSLTRHPDAH